MPDDLSAIGDDELDVEPSVAACVQLSLAGPGPVRSVFDDPPTPSPSPLSVAAFGMSLHADTRWAEQAIGLAYGPRKARAQGLLADIHRARADVEAERIARAAALATLEALPAAARNPDAIAKAKADLAAVGATK